MTSSNTNNNGCSSSSVVGGGGGSSSSSSRNYVFKRYPSNQRKLGPAPFASFESDEDAAAAAGAAAAAVGAQPPEPPKRLPEILEQDPLHSSKQSRSSSKSGLQTPSTPRIDISSASTPSNDESNNSDEKELFQGGLGLAFQEDDQDLRSSTEELDFEVLDFTEKKSRVDYERRASQPPPVDRKRSLTPEFFDRKLSLNLRHGSFGAAGGNIERPKSSLSMRSTASGRRSCSPHKMLLETSFCGNKPIPTPSMDLDSPPRTKEIVVPSPLLRTAEVTVHSVGTESAQTGAATVSSPESCNPSSCSPKSSHHWRPISPAQKLEFSHLPLYNHQQEYHEEPTELSLQDAPPPLKSHSTSTKANSTQQQAHSDSQEFFTPRESSEQLNEIARPFESGGDTKGSPGTSPLPPFNNPRSTPTPEPKQSIISSSSSSDSLPYVPTTLPLEKSTISITPVSQRSNAPLLPIERPRCSQQISPASLNDYIVHTTNSIEVGKMKISLPRNDSEGSTGGKEEGRSTVKKIGAGNWVDFAEMGLRSPRRRRTSRGGTIDFE